MAREKTTVDPRAILKLSGWTMTREEVAIDMWIDKTGTVHQRVYAKGNPPFDFEHIQDDLPQDILSILLGMEMFIKGAYLTGGEENERDS